eukprot:CAMPEP_0173060654 /NCGR_PEP_ID=MMETSP1102-20130122/2734_1 /TAXON_ID=49646 /ORGANISM="Geminigera sp., Strain Caron Lab Isolate" /LENGTH=183 /DNA_ID=CAMNT_0013926941 /DNA_START=58 /DNA_END=609 /DNA_ORIENTATION=-
MGNNPSVENIYDHHGQHVSRYSGPVADGITDWQANPMGGVGVVFVKDKKNNLYVNLMVKDGPAHLSGKIQQGDLLRYIDNYDIQASETSLDTMTLLSGKVGTMVTLGFQRSTSQAPVIVALLRTAACFPDQLMLPPPGYDFPSTCVSDEDMAPAVELLPLLETGKRVKPTVADSMTNKGQDFC